jgi:hypothetical protein
VTTIRASESERPLPTGLREHLDKSGAQLDRVFSRAYEPSPTSSFQLSRSWIAIKPPLSFAFTPKTLRRLARHGRVIGYRVGKLWSFYRSDLEGRNDGFASTRALREGATGVDMSRLYPDDDERLRKGNDRLEAQSQQSGRRVGIWRTLDIGKGDLNTTALQWRRTVRRGNFRLRDNGDLIGKSKSVT